jgi:hypothetical protein
MLGHFPGVMAEFSLNGSSISFVQSISQAPATRRVGAVHLAWDAAR